MNIIGNIVGVIAGLFIGIIAIGFIGAIITGDDASSKAACELMERSLDADVFLVRGEADAGYRYNVRVKNKGEKGDLTIIANLSTSEGEFERKQTLAFDSQEIRDLSFAFHEPTINASNIQGSITCRP